LDAVPDNLEGLGNFPTSNFSYLSEPRKLKNVTGDNSLHSLRMLLNFNKDFADETVLQK
jgi:hypothetical protein